MRHSMAAPVLADVGLRKRQRLARRNANLRLDQVDAGDHLRHRVLDLDAGVHLDEIVVALPIDDELDRAGVGVVGRLHQPHGRLAHGRAGAWRPAAGRGSPRSASGGGAASVQSRSQRCTTLPCRSASTCTSTCRGCSTYFSR